MRSLFRMKSIEEIIAAAKKATFKKTLGAFDLIMLGVGATIGTGIFVMTGVAAAEHAGPAISVSYIIAGMVCMFAGLAYAELASTVPVSGSAYTYSYAVLGEIIAWLVACGLVLEYTVAASTVAAGWSGYFVGIMGQGGINIPDVLTKSPSEGGLVNLPAVCIALFVGGILYRGTKESMVVNRILVGLKLAVIFIFLIVAAPHIEMKNYAEFFPFGWDGVFVGAAAIFFAYLGFDAIATTAEECKNPGRDLPIGIIGGLLVCTTLYVLVSLALTGMVDFRSLANAEPMARALRDNGSTFGSALVGTGAIAGMVTVLLVMMYGQSRIFFAMSRDGLIPAFFSKTHKQYGTPHLSCLFVTLAVASISGFTPLKTMGHMSSLGTLFAFCVVSIGVVVLRVKRPDLKRSFKCPAVYLVSALSILGCGYLIFKLLLQTGMPVMIWFAFGLVFYFAYSRKRSKLHQANS